MKFLLICTAIILRQVLAAETDGGLLSFSFNLYSDDLKQPFKSHNRLEKTQQNINT